MAVDPINALRVPYIPIRYDYTCTSFPWREYINSSLYVSCRFFREKYTIYSLVHKNHKWQIKEKMAIRYLLHPPAVTFSPVCCFLSPALFLRFPFFLLGLFFFGTPGSGPDSACRKPKFYLNGFRSRWEDLLSFYCLSM